MSFRVIFYLNERKWKERKGNELKWHDILKEMKGQELKGNERQEAQKIWMGRAQWKLVKLKRDAIDNKQKLSPRGGNLYLLIATVAVFVFTITFLGPCWGTPLPNWFEQGRFEHFFN